MASGLIEMRRVGLEPTRENPQEPKSCLSANSNIGAYTIYNIYIYIYDSRLLRFVFCHAKHCSRNRRSAFAIRPVGLLAHADQVL